MYNEDDKLEYVECTCTILAVRRKRRVEVKGENNILKCVGGGNKIKGIGDGEENQKFEKKKKENF